MSTNALIKSCAYKTSTCVGKDFVVPVTFHLLHVSLFKIINSFG